MFSLLIMAVSHIQRSVLLGLLHGIEMEWFDVFKSRPLDGYLLILSGRIDCGCSVRIIEDTNESNL